LKGTLSYPIKLDLSLRGDLIVPFKEELSCQGEKDFTPILWELLDDEEELK